MLVCDYCKYEIKKSDTYATYSFPRRIKDNTVLSWHEPSEICQKCAIKITKCAGIKIEDETVPTAIDNVKDLMKDPLTQEPQNEETKG
jgi:hypothetical protein